MMNLYFSFWAWLSGMLVLLTFHSGLAQNPFPDFPPEDVTRTMDRDQMLYQLGITLPELPPKQQDPHAPSGAYPQDSLNPEGNWRDAAEHTIVRSAWGLWNNYSDRATGFFPGPDSARLGSYTPINLLKMHDGTLIQTPEEWWQKRRPEILKDVQTHLYGLIPPDSLLPKVTFSVRTSRGGHGNAAYIQKEITGTIDTSRYPALRKVPVISAVLRVPAYATQAVPVMIVIAGFGNVLDRYWDITHPNGWGVCTFDPNALQPDDGTGLTSYLIGLVNQGNWRKPSDWGTIGAWSWGISRLIDYLETDEQVNEKQIGLTGHSRYGKATLVTTAYEPRIAIAFPSDGGSLGTKMNRRHWGQDLENSTGENEYHWMAGNFFQYAGELIPGQYLPRKIENLPVDAHSLLALCAPRPMLFNGGTTSTWTDPYGQYLTTVDASPVYELLGKKGMIMPDDKPKVDIGYMEGDLAYRYHEGGHTDAPDWPTFFAFASKYIQAPTLEIETSYLNLGLGKSTGKVIVKASQAWHLIGEADWLSMKKNKDAIVVTASENTGKTARSALLTIETQGIRRTLMINQACQEPKLTVSSKVLAVGEKEQDSISFAVKANTAWEVSCSEDWIYPVQEAGIRDKKVTLKALANPGVTPRKATLTVQASGVAPQTLSVTQAAGAPTLFVNTQALHLAETESSTSFFANSNTTWQVTTGDAWLTTDVSASQGFGRVSIRAESNPSTAPRKSQVIVRVDGLPDHTIEITQSGAEP